MSQPTIPRGTRSPLTMLTWLVRITGCVLIGVFTFAIGPPSGSDLALEVTGFLVCIAAIAYWLLFDLTRFALPHPVLVVALAVMAVVGGLLAMAPHGGALIGFSLIAVLAAGADPAWLTGWLIFAAAAVSVEVGALIWNPSTDAVWVYPLTFVVAFISGRNRRAYLIRARQSAALLVQMEQLRAEQRQVAVLDERTRIAREVHDVLAHSLGALGIQIQAVRAVLTDNHDVDRAVGLLEQAQRMATDGLRDTRRAVAALRGDSISLAQQLTTLVEAHRDRYRTAVDLTIASEPKTLSPEATVALIRTAQEALVNAAKHAAFQPIAVELSYVDSEVRLAVSNPIPSCVEARRDAAAGTLSTTNGGYGLTGMRERLLLINGALTVSSNDHRWSILARCPQ